MINHTKNNLSNMPAFAGRNSDIFPTQISLQSSLNNLVLDKLKNLKSLCDQALNKSHFIQQTMSPKVI